MQTNDSDRQQGNETESTEPKSPNAKNLVKSFFEKLQAIRPIAIIAIACILVQQTYKMGEIVIKTAEELVKRFPSEPDTSEQLAADTTILLHAFQDWDNHPEKQATVEGYLPRIGAAQTIAKSKPYLWSHTNALNHVTMLIQHMQKDGRERRDLVRPILIETLQAMVTDLAQHKKLSHKQLIALDWKAKLALAQHWKNHPKEWPGAETLLFLFQNVQADLKAQGILAPLQGLALPHCESLMKCMLTDGQERRAAALESFTEALRSTIGDF